MCPTKQAAYSRRGSLASSVQSAGTAANKYICSVASNDTNGVENEEESTSSWEWFMDEEDYYVDIADEPPRRQESLLLDSLDLVRSRRRSLSFVEARRDHDRLRFERTDSFELARAPRRLPQSEEAEENDCDSYVYQEDPEDTELPLNDEAENLQNPQEAMLSPRAKRTKPRHHRFLQHDYIHQLITSE